MTNEQLSTQLGILASMCYEAQLACVRDNFKNATEILQGQVTPLLQIVAHETWLRHHKSGLPPA